MNTDEFRKLLTTREVRPQGSLTFTGQADVGSTVEVLDFSGCPVYTPEFNDRTNLLIRNRGDKPLVIRGLRWTSDTKATSQHALLYAIDHSNLVLEDCELDGLAVGHFLDIRANTKAVGNITLRRCKFKASWARPDDTGRNPLTGGATGLEAVKFTGKVARAENLPPLAHYKKYFNAGSLEFPVEAVIEDCTFEGGYYGLSGEGLSRSLIKGNRFLGQMRAISLQNCSGGNTVVWNDIKDNLSAAIHMAYGSSFNTVFWNTIKSVRAHGEGLIQAYVGSSGNLVWANDLEVTNLAQDTCKVYLYSGPDSSYNRFQANTLKGTCSRAYMAVEEFWDPSRAARQSLAFNTPADNTGFTSRHITGVVFIDNQLQAATPGTMELYKGPAWQAN